jgi:hypothetical protein
MCTRVHPGWGSGGNGNTLRWLLLLLLLLLLLRSRLSCSATSCEKLRLIVHTLPCWLTRRLNCQQALFSSDALAEDEEAEEE